MTLESMALEDDASDDAGAGPRGWSGVRLGVGMLRARGFPYLKIKSLKAQKFRSFKLSKFQKNKRSKNKVSKFQMTQGSTFRNVFN